MNSDAKPELAPLSKDEAKEALERDSWTETPRDNDLTASYELARWLVRLDDPEDVDAREERRTVTLTKIIDRARAAVGDPPRRMIHGYLGRVGADNELDYAVARVDEADEVGWIEDPFFGHELYVRVGDRVYLYAARRPRP